MKDQTCSEPHHSASKMRSTGIFESTKFCIEQNYACSITLNWKSREKKKRDIKLKKKRDNGDDGDDGGKNGSDVAHKREIVPIFVLEKPGFYFSRTILLQICFSVT